MNDKKLDQAKRRHIRRLRFSVGLREITVHHRAKLAVLIGYLLIVALVWNIRGKLPLPVAAGGVSNMVLRGCISLVLLVVGAIIFVEIIIALGTPMIAAKVQANLTEAGFTNAVGLPPLLLSVHKGAHGIVYEFDKDNIPISQWEKDKGKIGAALNRVVTSVTQSANGERVMVCVAAHSALPEEIYWKDEYLSTQDFTLVLGIGLMGNLETFDLATLPHLLVGGGSGSGKSLLAKCLLMQGLKKGAAVTLADFKGGVDYSPAWHKKCRMVFEPDALRVALEDLTNELERRRGLFVKAGTPNLTEYNKATGEDLPRHILACDEVAEILDTTGLNKAEKEIFAQIVRNLSLIARQGRAFGIHLLLATQRPSADLIPGQIRTNLGMRICGRADDILSKIILDSPAATEQIPLDAKGRFVTNMGQTFQGFLFEDSILDE